MADNTNLSLTVESWAKIVVERWENKITMLRIHHSGNLAKSFAVHVFTQANGNPDKIEFAFNYYGKFVDMGVGNGVNMDQVGGSNRKAKPWYSRTFFSQVKRLSEIISENLATRAQLTILTNVEAFNASGNKINQPTATTSGRSNNGSVDSITGKQKVSYKEFEQNRKKNGW